jgi:hypothetical protein
MSPPAADRRRRDPRRVNLVERSVSVAFRSHEFVGEPLVERRASPTVRAVRRSLLSLFAVLSLSSIYLACSSDDSPADAPSAAGGQAGTDANGGDAGAAAGIAGKAGNGAEAGAAGSNLQAGGAQAAGSGGAPSAGSGGDTNAGSAGIAGGAGVGGDASGGASATGGTGGSGAAGAAGQSGAAGAAGGPPGKCVKTICMGGAVQSDPYEGGNEYLAPLCEKLEGLIPNCDAATGKCIPMFGWLDGKAPAQKALYHALDTTGDGFLDDADAPCEIRLVGYSWGGLNARDIAQAWAEDSNVPDARKAIATLAAIDPFRIGDLEYLVPANVQVFREYRHSIAPSNDCSGSAPFGPYKGLVPRCGPTSECQDFDYSLAPDELFPTLSGSPKTIAGKKVEHCNAADVAAVPVLALLAGQAAPKLPPPQPVKALKP